MNLLMDAILGCPVFCAVTSKEIRSERLDAGEGGRTVRRPFRQLHFFVIGLILFVGLAAAIVVNLRRPRLQVSMGEKGIYVTNTGATTADIFRVNAFWYRESQVGYLADMPDVVQQVPPEGGDAGPARLDIPGIPSPKQRCGDRAPCFMRMVIHYQIPRIPVFRYRSIAYFRFDEVADEWRTIDTLPARYRSLGNMGRGDVEMIEVWQQ